jgi:hypothetical protein
MYRTEKTPIPHSWPVSDWPAHVYPNDAGRGRYLTRANRDDLVAAGALARVGRELVVIGDRYARWLQKRSADVPGFEIAPNRRHNQSAPQEP